MQDLSLRVLLALVAVALIAACASSFALVASQGNAPAGPAGDLYVYGQR
jgi:hypothetical protein